MSSETDPINNTTLTPRPSIPFRWSLRRRRPKLPTARLGGKKPRRGFFLLRICKKAKLRWLKMKYSCMLKRLKNYYKALVRDMIDGSATIEAFQQRMLLESSFAVPVMGLNLSSYQHW